MKSTLTYRVLLTLFFLATANLLFAQKVKDLEAKKKDTEKEIAYVNSLLSKTGSEKVSAIQQLDLLRTKIRYRKQLVSSTEIQIGIVSADIKQMKGEVGLLQQQLSDLKEAYAGLLSAIYMKRRNATWLMYVMASDDLSQAYRRLKYFQSFANLALIQAQQIKESSTTLEVNIVKLEEKKVELAAFQKSKEAEVKLLAVDEDQAQTLQKELEKKERTLKASLKEKQKSLQSLSNEIERIMREEMAKRTAAAGTKTTTGSSSAAANRALPAVDKELSSSFEANRGKLPWPLKKGVVAGHFGKQEHPLFKSFTLELDGIDISTDSGAEVVAIFNGEVARIFSITGLGNCLMVRHGEYFSVYCRLRNISVKAGDKVKTGSVLATVDNNSDGAAVLHFGLWKGISKLNPELWLASK